jgi:hypothetical protein
MDRQQYQRIYIYLQNNTLPNDLLTSQTKKQFKNFCKPFIIHNQFLYRKDKRKNGSILKVIQAHEVEPILYMTHKDPTAAHFSVDIMFNKIRNQYFWPQMYETIREYVQTCDECQRRGSANNPQLLHPIAIIRPFYQIGVDYVGPLPKTEKNNRYIIVAMDYFTKWPEAKAVPVATAEETINFLYEEIICRHGCPQRILSDRGTHFNNKLVMGLMNKFRMKHLLSTPYHPQTNGLVERFNRTLCESLAKLVEKEDEWDLFISPVLLAYRTSIHSTTKVTPFLLAYGREANMPFDDPSINKQVDEDPLLKRYDQIINKMPNVQQEVQARVTDQQTKQKQRHDDRIKKTLFAIGDKVLMYDKRLDNQWSGKLREKWKGPYYIHSIGHNDAYKLRSIIGQVLKTPVNDSLLKTYRERTNYLENRYE